MNFKIKVKDKEYDVAITGVEATNQVKISINGKDFLFDMGESITNKDESVPLIQASMPKKSFNKEVKATLAGVISNIFVKEGELIKSGQKILTLSAMKMENEIVSEFDGKIKKITVESGQKVKEGDTLIELV